MRIRALAYVNPEFRIYLVKLNYPCLIAYNAVSLIAIIIAAINFSIWANKFSKTHLCNSMLNSP